MPTLAPKLPYTHPFAGGYPRVGGQALPTDPDAIDYLNRVAAADGAAVEVGVAMAVDAFVRGCKADGIWSALKASCILCGARTISGALVPLVGAAPTPYNFASGDYDRETGLKGDGATKYLDSNRANDADGKDDNHNAVYVTAAGTLSASRTHLGSTNFVAGRNYLAQVVGSGDTNFSSRSQSPVTLAGLATGFLGHQRSISTTIGYRANGTSYSDSQASETSDDKTLLAFARRNSSTFAAEVFSDARLAFYSIGSALDLAALDNRVSTLVSQIAAAI